MGAADMGGLDDVVGDVVPEAVAAKPQAVINGSLVGIHQQSGIIDAYLAVPEQARQFKGAVIIVHELWGLTEHIMQVADRLAMQGYYVLAPDLYSGKGHDRRMSEELQRAIFSRNEHERYAAQPKLRAMLEPTQTPQFASMALQRLQTCFEYMYNQPLVHQRVAIIGFGLGGTYAYDMALHEPRLKAALPFYGHCKHTVPELRHITTPILAFYGGQDKALASELKTLSAHMHDAHVDFLAIKYSAAGHAFFNDANPFSYRPSDASDAWRRVLSFLRDKMV